MRVMITPRPLAVAALAVILEPPARWPHCWRWCNGRLIERRFRHNVRLSTKYKKARRLSS